MSPGISLVTAAGLVFAGVAVAAWQAAVWVVGARSAARGRVPRDPLARPLFPRLGAAALAAAGAGIGLASTGVPAIAVVGAWAGWTLPQRILDARHAALLDRLDRQLVELVRSLRESVAAGMNLVESVDYAAARLRPPIRDEVGRLAGELRMGRRLDGSFAALAARIGTVTARRLAEAMAMGLRYGGSLRATLEHLERQMVRRFEASDKRRARTHSARREGALVAATVPVMLLVYLTTMGSGVADFYRGVPGTLVLVGVGVVMLVARLWIRRIVGEGARV